MLLTWAIEALIPAGFNPHAYEPRAEDIKRIGTLDVIVLNGVGHDAYGVEAGLGTGHHFDRGSVGRQADHRGVARKPLPTSSAPPDSSIFNTMLLRGRSLARRLVRRLPDPPSICFGTATTAPAIQPVAY